MAIPVIVSAAALLAGATGVTGLASGATKTFKANKVMKEAKHLHERNVKMLEDQNVKTCSDMDKLGNAELKVLNSFEDFSKIFEKIHNKPEFGEINLVNVKLPDLSIEELKKVSIGAGVLLGGLGGAALGTAGGFAASGATTTAVMTFATASTGTAISTLSGAAAVNAILAALGGGSIAAGGGGIALGTMVLGAATAGVGILIGGIVFGISGTAISKKADKAHEQMKKAEIIMKDTCIYLYNLSKASNEFYETLCKVNDIYGKHMVQLSYIVEANRKTDWNEFNEVEKLTTKNTVLLVSLLKKMCSTKFVTPAVNIDELNILNSDEINTAVLEAKAVLKHLG